MTSLKVLLLTITSVVILSEAVPAAQRTVFDLEDLVPQLEATTTSQNDLIDLYVDFDQESLNQIIQRLDPVSGGQFRLLKRTTMPAIKGS